MEKSKFIFAGNRFFVLQQMLARNLDLEQILAVEGSFLARVLAGQSIPHTVLESKDQLIATLRDTEFDYFVANGCPFILPISELQDGRKHFVNVHPSPLPDLRGADPVPGALLFGRDSGATCHVMDDGIDTGGIIARVTIPNTPDLDCGLLYQLSFLAEPEVFNLALERRFEPAARNDPDGTIYYSRQAADLEIDFAEPTDAIVRRVKAWNTRSQGARFTVDGEVYRVMDAEEVTNPYLLGKLEQFAENEVVFNYENALLIRHGGSFLKLKAIEGDLSKIGIGRVL